MSSETPEVWRMRGFPLYLLFAFLTLVTSGTSAVLRLSEPREGSAHRIVDGVLLLLVTVTTMTALVLAFRTRVRVLPEGLEVRELRTRLYPWPSVSDVRLDRLSGSRRITIVLGDGRTRLLPTPVLGRQPDSGERVARAVAAIQSRLLPNRPPVVADEPTSLDDLLHE